MVAAYRLECQRFVHFYDRHLLATMS
ncbi:unnamed protein product [Nezara viridula]|uniref:Uncharacterized protein n=1 Tax=Nezara viridula TaxID=85310 RepID=A0A9P0HU53_NEZVI|nr:unnamed protein product [Nezara viridula]